MIALCILGILTACPGRCRAVYGKNRSQFGFFCGARNVTPTGSAFGAAGYLAPNGRLVVRGSAASDAGLSLSCNEKRPPRRLFPHSKLRRLAGNRACSV